jgi:hypothetical protein
MRDSVPGQQPFDGHETEEDREAGEEASAEPEPSAQGEPSELRSDNLEKEQDPRSKFHG